MFIPGKSYIPVSGAEITDDDKTYLHDVVDKGWYTEGFYCKSFENQLKEITGKKHIQLVNSGSSASLIAMTAALRKFDPGCDRPYVLTCATAFPTTISPIYQNGRIPIYVDIDPETLKPKHEQILYFMNRYYQEISGAIFTHTMGFPFDEWFFRGLLNDVFFVVDSCDALGTKINGDPQNEQFPVGTYADLSTYSFFPAHHITSGEGGAVATDDPELAEELRSLSNWGRNCYCEPGQTNTCGKRFEWKDRGGLPEGWDHKYIFSNLGYNLKMTEFQGALGYSQSLRLEDITFDRKVNYEQLYTGLNRKYVYLIERPMKTSPFGFPILVNEDAPFTAQELIAYLEENKIRTRRLFAGNITKQPGFINLPSLKLYSLDGSDRVMNDMFWIGCHPSLTTEMLDYVIEVFNKFMDDEMKYWRL